MHSMIENQTFMGSQSLIDFFFNYSGKGVLLLSGSGKVEKVNPLACRLLSCEPEQVLNRDIYKVWECMGKDLAPALPPMGEPGRVPLESSEGFLHLIPLCPAACEGPWLLIINNQGLDSPEADRAEKSILKAILELAYDGIIVVNKDGIVTMMSTAYKRFLGISDTDVVGKHVTDVVPSTRMHIVTQTGIPEANAIQEIKGNHMIATRIPFYTNGKITGAIGKVQFRNLSELANINRKIETMEQRLNTYKKALGRAHKTKYTLDSILTKNARMEDLKEQVRKIGYSRSNITILGESGTGKELFAHAIHANSDRADAPFVKLNCAAIPENLLESELFGYGKGAFTGAAESRVGKFELANGGTLFLDEIGDMPLHMQAKILRPLQEGEVERVGTHQPVQVDVRVIAATNKDLKAMIRNKTFREDLFYRINVLTIDIPPLRERKDDLRMISERFIDELSRQHYKPVTGLSPLAYNLLMSYDWPGNIRELKNVIEKAYYLLDGASRIEAWHLPANLKKNSSENENISLKTLLEETEKQILTDRITAFKGNKTKAAKALGISRVTLHKKISRYELTHL